MAICFPVTHDWLEAIHSLSLETVSPVFDYRGLQRTGFHAGSAIGKPETPSHLSATAATSASRCFGEVARPITWNSTAEDLGM